MYNIINDNEKFTNAIAWSSAERYICIRVPPFAVFWQKPIGIKLFWIREMLWVSMHGVSDERNIATSGNDCSILKIQSIGNKFTYLS
jgi:hypothetical protein